jgi:hypothetical protein
MEARKDKRFKKKLLVSIDAGTVRFGGITSDISDNGMFIRGVLLPNDIELTIELCLPGNKISSLLGIVKRNVKIPEANWLYGSGLELIKKDYKFCNFLKALT